MPAGIVLARLILLPQAFAATQDSSILVQGTGDALPAHTPPYPNSPK